MKDSLQIIPYILCFGIALLFFYFSIYREIKKLNKKIKHIDEFLLKKFPSDDQNNKDMGT